MKAVQLLRQQLQAAHETLEMTMADVKDDVLHFNDTGKALPVAGAYAHAVLAEDMILTYMLSKKPSLVTDYKKIGLSAPMPSMQEWDKHEEWYKTVKLDLPKFQEFAKKVYKATDDYLATLTDKDLEKEEERPHIGKRNLAWLISNFVILHIANLTGEISAAKGIQGLKGYPF